MTLDTYSCIWLWLSPDVQASDDTRRRLLISKCQLHLTYVSAQMSIVKEIRGVHVGARALSFRDWTLDCDALSLFTRRIEKIAPTLLAAPVPHVWASLLWSSRVSYIQPSFCRIRSGGLPSHSRVLNVATTHYVSYTPSPTLILRSRSVQAKHNVVSSTAQIQQTARSNTAAQSKSNWNTKVISY